LGGHLGTLPHAAIRARGACGSDVRFASKLLRTSIGRCLFLGGLARLGRVCGVGMGARREKQSLCGGDGRDRKKYEQLLCFCCFWACLSETEKHLYTCIMECKNEALQKQIYTIPSHDVFYGTYFQTSHSRSLYYLAAVDPDQIRACTFPRSRFRSTSPLQTALIPVQDFLLSTHDSRTTFFVCAFSPCSVPGTCVCM
jgi:hypothetical protein